MPPRRAATGQSAPAISANHFCWTCVCILGTSLVGQICLLVSLLGRLAEVQHAGELQSTVKIANASTTSAIDVELSKQGLATPAAVGTSMDFLAVACAVGADQDATVLFVRSYQRATPSELVLLVEQMPLESDLRDSGVDLTRLKLEKVLPLPSMWSMLSREDTYIFYIHQYLQRMPGQVKIMQLSNVDDIVFQADPFAWASEQEPGLHLFLDEPGVVVNSGKAWKLIEFCYGTQAARLHSKPRVPAGYMIGSSADLQQFVSDLVGEVTSRGACREHAGSGERGGKLHGAPGSPRYQSASARQSQRTCLVRVSMFLPTPSCQTQRTMSSMRMATNMQSCAAIMLMTSCGGIFSGNSTSYKHQLTPMHPTIVPCFMWKPVTCLVTTWPTLRRTPNLTVAQLVSLMWAVVLSLFHFREGTAG